ncbi:MAG: acetate/propionate family kinase [Burkholderiaceae bacterium]
MPHSNADDGPPHVLAINAGSSSLKFALYEATELLQLRLRGKIERIGLQDTTLTVTSPGTRTQRRVADVFDHSGAARELTDWLEKERLRSAVQAVGHRVVHGGARDSSPARVDDKLVKALYEITPYSPEHLPVEIALIEYFLRHFPNVPQIACFDTSFHRHMPRVAQLLPIPRRYEQKGIRRYGFHGLSYAYLMEELERAAGTRVAHGRVVLAHLGNGSSLAAVRRGESVDTTMALTPASGIPMSTRSGDLDPGLAWCLARSENMDAEGFHRMANHESGLAGISETSSDMADLLASEAADVRAAEAVALYCYQVTKAIGSLAAALAGLDTLVFSGGIGENAPEIRQRICAGLGFLGISIDVNNNARNDGVISADTATVTVRMIRTDEEAMIARSTLRFLNEQPVGS